MTKAKKQIVKTIQLFNVTTLQQMNEEKKEKNEKIISVDKKLTKNVKMKRIIEKKFLKKEILNRCCLKFLIDSNIISFTI